MVNPGTWLHDLVEVYNDLGGEAAYKQVYSKARERRLARGATWTAQAEASIRRTIEDHARSSNNFRGNEVFYSVNGHGRGVWALMPEYLRTPAPVQGVGSDLYAEGLEGIAFEHSYLRRSRDPRLVETRKRIDNYTCRACDFRLEIGEENYVIDVHHLKPLGASKSVVITSIDDLVCLCPTCHRIAHSAKEGPLPLEAIRSIRSRPS